MKFLLFSILVLILIGIASAASIYTTDIFGFPKYDFAPEEIVYIHGIGFESNSIIFVDITRPDEAVERRYGESNLFGEFLVEYNLNGITGSYSVLADDFTNQARTIFQDAAIWTTKNDCGSSSQDANLYNIGESIYINGNSFSAGNYSWSITGKPGGASCDPNIVVASGIKAVNSSGKFCFNAYLVNSNDCGEYQVKFGTKGDNYRVKGASCSSDSQCGVSSSSLSCSGKNILNSSITPRCISGICDIINNVTIKEGCVYGCFNSVCVNNMSCVEAKNAGLLTGSVVKGNATVVNKGFFTYKVGLAVYKMFDENIDNQIIFDWDSGFVAPNSSLKLYVDRPDCKYQIDLFCGDVLFSLNGSRYKERLLGGAMGVGSNYCVREECGNGIVEEGEECDDGNNIDGDGCNSNCEIEPPCPDEDGDCVCDEEDDCPNSRQGELIDINGCDPFQFCKIGYCGTSCEGRDFIPRFLNCEEVDGEPEGNFPGDCITVVIPREGELYPGCFPTTCLN